MNYYDARETRDPALRERDLLARLPAQIAHARAKTAAYARLLAHIDPATIGAYVGHQTPVIAFFVPIFICWLTDGRRGVQAAVITL